jgi:hypothetical protein
MKKKTLTLKYVDNQLWFIDKRLDTIWDALECVARELDSLTGSKKWRDKKYERKKI